MKTQELVVTAQQLGSYQPTANPNLKAQGSSSIPGFEVYTVVLVLLVPISIRKLKKIK